MENQVGPWTVLLAVGPAAITGLLAWLGGLAQANAAVRLKKLEYAREDELADRKKKADAAKAANDKEAAELLQCAKVVRFFEHTMGLPTSFAEEHVVNLRKATCLTLARRRAARPSKNC